MDALAVKSRYPHTRVSPYESVASTPAHTNCTHFRPVDCLQPAKALAAAAPPAGFEPATRRLEDVGKAFIEVCPRLVGQRDQGFCALQTPTNGYELLPQLLPNLLSRRRAKGLHDAIKMRLRISVELGAEGSSSQQNMLHVAPLLL